MQTTEHRAYVYHTHKKRECQRKTRRNRERQEKRNLMFRLKQTINHHFPDRNAMNNERDEHSIPTT